MLFNKHSGITDKDHAFLSPSQPSWLNYDKQKLIARLNTVVASRRGMDLHKLAHDSIRLRVYIDNVEQALSYYVADGIEYEMLCEQPLVYSEYAFGKADTISFDEHEKVLRIHDLKTGIVKAKMEQLQVYAALFCLEYGIDPYDITIVLRIYQRDNVEELMPIPELIEEIMQTIVHFDQLIKEEKGESW